MPNMRPEDHQREWMARPSYSLPGLWRHGQPFQLALTAPQLSQTGASSEVRRNETGYGDVPGGGLSRMRGQLSRTVLRGLVGSDAHLATRLYGYEVRQYLLEKWGRKCVYCGAEHVPLQVEHIVPRAVRVDNRICNLALACAPCNTKKGTQDIHVFLAGQPDLVARILAQAKAPLKDATAVNATRWRLYEGLLALGLPVERGSGGLTKFNRTRRAFPKTHWLDAACVGKNTPERLRLKGVVPLLIKANGHGCRQLCLMDEHGFPRT